MVLEGENGSTPSLFRYRTCGNETSHGSTHGSIHGTTFSLREMLSGQRRSIRCTTIQDLSSKTLDSLIEPSSSFFFDALQLDTLLFEEDVKNCPEIECCQNAKKTLRAL